MRLIVYNPTNRHINENLSMAKRLGTLNNTSLAIVNNGKRQSDVILNEIIDNLKLHYTFNKIKFFQKHSVSQAMSDDLAQTIAATYDSVITGVGD